MFWACGPIVLGYDGGLVQFVSLLEGSGDLSRQVTSRLISTLIGKLLGVIILI